MQWQPFPSTAPTDRPILVRGKWRPFDILAGGGTSVVVGWFGSLAADGADPMWFVALSFVPLESINVDFTEWMDIPS